MGVPFKEYKMSAFQIVVFIALVMGFMLCAFYLGAYFGKKIGFDDAMQKNIENLSKMPIASQDIGEDDVDQNIATGINRYLEEDEDKDGDDEDKKEEDDENKKEEKDTINILGSKKVVKKDIPQIIGDDNKKPLLGDIVEDSDITGEVKRKEIKKEIEIEKKEKQEEEKIEIKKDVKDDIQENVLEAQKELEKINKQKQEEEKQKLEKEAKEKKEQELKEKEEKAKQEEKALKEKREEEAKKILEQKRKEEEMKKANIVVPTVVKTPVPVATKPIVPQQQNSYIPKGYYAQIATTGSLEEAQRLQKIVRESGFKSVVETITYNGGQSFKVLVGPEEERVQAERLIMQLKREPYIQGMPFIREAR